jgi:hypothetical protein
VALKSPAAQDFSSLGAQGPKNLLRRTSQRHTEVLRQLPAVVVDSRALARRRRQTAGPRVTRSHHTPVSNTPASWFRERYTHRPCAEGSQSASIRSSN